MGGTYLFETSNMIPKTLYRTYLPPWVSAPFMFVLLLFLELLLFLILQASAVLPEAELLCCWVAILKNFEGFIFDIRSWRSRWQAAEKARQLWRCCFRRRGAQSVDQELEWSFLIYWEEYSALNPWTRFSLSTSVTRNGLSIHMKNVLPPTMCLSHRLTGVFSYFFLSFFFFAKG